jgi:hypothetical protein
MTLLVAWLVFPLVLGLLALGCGLLVQRSSGRRLPRALLLPVGLTGVIVVSDLATISARTAFLAVPLVVIVAVAGFGLAFPWRPRKGDPWATVSAIAVYLVYGAPVVLSGQATFAGYIKLDDTATFLGFIDRLMQHGRGTAGLAPSTYEAILTAAGNGYSSYPLRLQVIEVAEPFFRTVTVQ